VLLHGFTQTGLSWAPVAMHLQRDGVEVVAPDCPGHGTASDLDLSLTQGARHLALQCGRGDWVGYSMGGRFLLHVALHFPEVVERMVLVSTTAGIEDEAERAQRREEDEQRARQLMTEGLEPFLRTWLASPLFANLSADAAGLESRMGNTAAGLASSLRRAGTGTQEPLWHRLPDLTMPVLVVAGASDAKFADLAFRMAELIPKAELVLLDGGHSIHLERPQEFAATVDRFLGT
jgi:2-succinyl-6-hydroxy-2,4-cyclohexadiene-1-carboxylate synthase